MLSAVAISPMTAAMWNKGFLIEAFLSAAGLGERSHAHRAWRRTQSGVNPQETFRSPGFLDTACLMP
jgi:hypothetical protein